MKWFRELKIGAKLILSFSLIALFAAIIGIIGAVNLRSIDLSYSEVWNNNAIPISIMADVLQHYQNVRLNSVKIVFENEKTKIESMLHEMDEDNKEINEKLHLCLASISSAQEENLKNELLAVKESYEKILSQIKPLALNNSDDEARLIVMGPLAENAKKYRALLETWININIKEGEAANVLNTEKASAAIRNMIILLVLGFILSIGLGVLISNMITKPVNKVLFMAQEMQKGHIKARTNLDGKDELGHMGKVLDQFVSQVDSSIVGTLNKIADGNVSFTVPMYDKDDEIAPVLNKVTSTVRDLITELNILTASATEGKLSIRGNEEKFQGGYREIVSGVNKTLDAVITPIQKGSEILKEMSKGNLAIRFHGEYKGDHQLIKNSINQLAESLNHALLEVNQAVQATASAAAEISSSSEQMAAGAHEQTGQTTEIAGSVEQMTKTILENSQHAGTAADKSKKANDSARDGSVKVMNTKKGMLRIVESSKATGEKITSLARKTDQIGEITQVIDDIADQTNLLALNAAIEAARAGEQGRGFAVVADEVRKLAERTTKATKQIAETIKEIQFEAKQADQSMLLADEAVQEGMKLTEEVAGSLDSILSTNNEVTEIIFQVAAASEEQSSAAEEISKNIEGISSITQQNAAGTEQIAKAAEDLNRLTVKLQELVSKFNLSDNKHNLQYNSVADKYITNLN